MANWKMQLARRGNLFLDDSFGIAGQAGVDGMLSPNWSLNA